MNKIIMLVGLPGSGKSVYAEKLEKEENYIIHASDRLREEMFGDSTNNENNHQLFQKLHKRIKNDLSENKNVIFDATNISYKRRRAFVQEIKKYNCKKECYLIATPYELCLKRNKKRNRQVPEHVITRMYKTIYIPQYYEGWNEI
ncbi:MAG: AAA family ATPase, partial [bacterium]